MGVYKEYILNNTSKYEITTENKDKVLEAIARDFNVDDVDYLAIFGVIYVPGIGWVAKIIDIRNDNVLAFARVLDLDILS